MKRLIATWLVFSLTTLPGFAQKTVNDWQAVRGLAVGRGIVVKTVSGEKLHGDFITATDESLVLDSEERRAPGRRIQQRNLARTDVLEVRGYNREGSILAATGIGAGVGAGIGAGIDASAKSNEDKGLATAVFALLGALFGSIIGRHAVIVKGELIFLRG